jgi:general secretion pathway protein L
MATLTIILPLSEAAQSTPCEHVRADDANQIVHAGSSPLAMLPAAAGAEVVVLVPIQKLSWHRLTLPKGTLGRSTASRLRSVLEGLLEEQLLDDPAQLHFALEPDAREGNPVRIAACDRQWLQGWIAALELAGIAVARIVPEMAPAAKATGATPPPLQAIGTPEQPELVHTTADGITLLPLSAAAAIMFNLSDTHSGPLPVTAEPGVAALAEQIFKRPVTLQTRAERAVAAGRSAWDLAQFDLLRTRGTRTRKHITALSETLLRAPRWRAARWATGALLVVNLAGVQAWAWKEQTALAAKRAAIKATLIATFPEVNVVVDAPLQMARALAGLQRQSGTASGADLETMLGQFQAAAPGSPAPTAIEFVANELQLKGLDASAPALNDVAARLQSRGYAARWDADALLLRQEVRP